MNKCVLLVAVAAANVYGVFITDCRGLNEQNKS